MKQKFKLIYSIEKTKYKRQIKIYRSIRRSIHRFSILLWTSKTRKKSFAFKENFSNFLCRSSRERERAPFKIRTGRIEFPKLIVQDSSINLPAPARIKAIAMIHPRPSRIPCCFEYHSVARRLLNSADQRVPQITTF